MYNSAHLKYDNLSEIFWCENFFGWGGWGEWGGWLGEGDIHHQTWIAWGVRIPKI